MLPCYSRLGPGAFRPTLCATYHIWVNCFNPATPISERNVSIDFLWQKKMYPKFKEFAAHFHLSLSTLYLIVTIFTAPCSHTPQVIVWSRPFLIQKSRIFSWGRCHYYSLRINYEPKGTYENISATIKIINLWRENISLIYTVQLIKYRWGAC